MQAISRAAIFDWDGVIIDSSRPHERSWEMLAAETGRSLPPDHFTRGFGSKNEVIIPDILQWTTDPEEIRRLSLRKEELYREIIRGEGIFPLPGVRPFLERLRKAGVPCAIGSSSHRLNIDLCLELFGLGDFFPAIASSEDVDRGKPDPAVFLAAAAKLGVAPERCVVFEDAPVGIEAALRGGMGVVGVAGSHPREALSAAQRVVNRLDELAPEDLERLAGAT